MARFALCLPKLSRVLLCAPLLGACAGAEPSASAAEPGRSQTATGASSRHGPPARSQRGDADRARTERAPRTAAEPQLSPEAEAWVAAHNLHRARVSPAASPALPAVRWSEELAARAQRWAGRCEFEHSQAGGDYGENLSARTWAAGPDEIVGDWAAEAEHFDYRSNRCASGEVCGHYTQVVWRDSTEIGCATVRCGGGGPFGASEWMMSVCNYSPAGNWSGQKPY